MTIFFCIAMVTMLITHMAYNRHAEKLIRKYRELAKEQNELIRKRNEMIKIQRILIDVYREIVTKEAEE